MTLQQNKSVWLQLQSILNFLNHMLILMMAVYFLVLARSLDFKDTAMHMFMTGTGYHVLAAEALMSHYSVNPITRWISHRNKSRFHGMLQLVGGTMAVLGALGKISQTEVHFTSWHGKFGLVATLACAASLLGGLANFFQPKFALKVFSPTELKFRHNLFGLLTFTITMSTIYLSYYSKFVLKYVDHNIIPLLMFVTFSVYLLTLIGPVQSLLAKLKHHKQKNVTAN